MYSRAVDSAVAIFLFLGLLGAVTYEHAADRIDPYIHNLWNPQHSGVHYAINCGGPKVLGVNNILYSADVPSKATPAGHPAAHDDAAPADGTYTLVLKFSENVMHHTKGTRVFSAKLNQKHNVAKTLDVFSEVGLRKRWD
eukprot:gene18101-28070_t